MKIILGPSSRELGEKIAELTGFATVPVAFRVFPDGESYVRLETSVKDEHVAIVQTTCKPQDSNLMQLAFLANAAKRNGAKKVTAVVPYFAYARQDKIFLEGENVSIETIAAMLKAAGIRPTNHRKHSRRKRAKQVSVPSQNPQRNPTISRILRQERLHESVRVGTRQRRTVHRRTSQNSFRRRKRKPRKTTRPIHRTNNPNSQTLKRQRQNRHHLRRHHQHRRNNRRRSKNPPRTRRNKQSSPHAFTACSSATQKNAS